MSVSLEEPTSSEGMRDRARQFESDERSNKQQRAHKRSREEWELDSNADSSTPSTEELEAFELSDRGPEQVLMHKASDDQQFEESIKNFLC